MSQEKSAQLQYLVGVDALGRSFGPAAVSPGKTVGMFFWFGLDSLTHPVSMTPANC